MSTKNKKCKKKVHGNKGIQNRKKGLTEEQQALADKKIVSQRSIELRQMYL